MIELTTKWEETAPNIFTVSVPRGWEPAFAALRAKCKAGYVSIKVQPPRKARTTGERSQSHHLNGHIQTICVATGGGFDEVKMAVKLAAIDRGYPFREFRGAIVPQSEAEASVEECAMLIDSVHQIAAEMGIALVEYDE